jgi:N-acetylglucosamine kinase-like BadF-type ATPase
LNIKNDFDIIDIVHGQYIGSRDKIAALQLLTKDAALAGSKSAKSLYEAAAGELCCLVRAIRNTLDFQQNPYMVSYSGGLYKTGNLILPYFFEGIEALGGKPVSPKYEPMYGALLLAFEKSNPEGLQKLQERLEKF